MTAFDIDSRDRPERETEASSATRTWFWKALGAILGSWVIYSAWIYLNDGALVPDEQSFLMTGKAHNLLQIFTEASPSGYGQSFWALMHFTNAFSARAVALMALVSTPLFVLFTMDRGRPENLVAVALLWLTMPIAWWTGKLIGPELLTMGLSSAAIWALARNRSWLSGALAGFAVGLKLTSLPIVVFLAAICLLQRERRTLTFLKFLVAAVPAAYVAYPGILTARPPGVVAGEIDLPGTLSALSLHRWEQDGVFSGGALAFTLALPCFLGFVALGLWCATRTTLALMAGVTCLLAVLSTSLTQYGWYSLPLVPAVLYVASQCLQVSVVARTALQVVSVVNLAFQLPTSIAMAQQKFAQMEALRDTSWVACVDDSLADVPDGARLFDMSEFGAPLQRPEKMKLASVAEFAEAEVSVVMNRLMVSPIVKTSLIGSELVQVCGAALVFKRLPATGPLR